MKVIYSYIPHNNSGGVISIKLISLLYLSVLKAKQFYEKVEMYTNQEIKHQLLSLGIPFTKIDTTILEGENANTASIPKLKTYASQTEPFIHIDIDTVLFQKVLFNPEIPVTFAHPDFKLKGDTILGNQIELLKAYFYPLNSGKLPKHYIDNLIPNNIPNMNIVAVTNPKLFSEVVNKSLNLYYKEKEYFDDDWYRFCTIEQLSIWIELLSHSPNYQELANDGECFLHQSEPLIINEQSNPILLKINSYTKRSIKLNSCKEIKKLEHEDFGGYAHFSGVVKESNFVQTLILYKLVKEFGSNPLQEIVDYFGGRIPQEVTDNLKELNILTPKFTPTRVL